MFKNVASQHIGALVLEDDGITPFSGTVDVIVSKDGGATASGGGTVTDRGDGLFDYAPTQAETNADLVAFVFTGTGAINELVETYTSPVTPDVNTVQISGDSTAADNAEAAFDGSGYNVGAGQIVAASVTAGVSLAAGAITAIWDKATSALTTAGSIGKLLVDNINATISSRLASSGYTTPPTANENADALLGRNVAGGSSSGRLVKEAFYRLRNRVRINAGTATVYGTDDSTSSWTAAVTTTAGNPVSEVDPS